MIPKNCVLIIHASLECDWSFLPVAWRIKLSNQTLKSSNRQWQMSPLYTCTINGKWAHYTFVIVKILYSILIFLNYLLTEYEVSYKSLKLIDYLNFKCNFIKTDLKANSMILSKCILITIFLPAYVWPNNRASCTKTLCFIELRILMVNGP